MGNRCGLSAGETFAFEDDGELVCFALGNSSISRPSAAISET
jgi:hypothetical protein